MDGLSSCEEKVQNSPKIIIESELKEALEANHARTSSESTPYCTESDEDNENKSKSKTNQDANGLGSKQVDVVLTDELKEKIITQAEFYLSDENLRKDGFLLKHVRRNKEGFVNLKLLSSFKKLKTISKDHLMITEALKDAKELVINEEGTKIRRITPLPEDLCEKPPVKTIVVSKIPSENPSMDFIADALPNSSEEIVSMRIIRAGKKFPNDLQAHFARHQELHDDNVAVIEFESPQSALNAVNLDFSTNQKYQGMIVSLLEVGSKLKARKNRNDGGDLTDEEQATKKREKSKGNKSRKQDRITQLTASGDEGSGSYYSSSDSEQTMYTQRNGHLQSPRNSPVSSPQLQRYNRKNITPDSSPASSPRSSPWNRRRANGNPPNGLNMNKVSPLAKTASPCSSPETRRKRDGKPQSPWLARKQILATENASNNLKNPSPGIGVIRQPRGPDGTKGFTRTFNQTVLPMEVAMS